MSTNNWSKRIDDGRASAQAKITSLSSSAQEAAQAARARIGSTYGHARNRAVGFATDGRALAQDGAAIGAAVADKGRKAMDRAMLSSRGLIAERPVTAVIAGLAAGILVGFLANRAAENRKARRALDIDDEFVGG